MQNVDLGAADGVLVKGVVPNGHDHREDVEASWLSRGGLVWVSVGEGESGVAEVDARGNGGDPGGYGGVNWEVGGGNAELLMLVCWLRSSIVWGKYV